MKWLKDISDRVRRGPTDVVGLHLEHGATRAVRIRKVGTQHHVTAAALLPPHAMPDADEDSAMHPLALPARFRAPYAAIAVADPQALVKLLSFPGAFDERAEQRVPSSMGLKDSDGFRVATRIMTAGHGKGESRVLAVAIPDANARALAQLLPTGIPAPCSLEVSNLAAMTSFMRHMKSTGMTGAVGAMDIGTRVSAFTLFHKGIPLLFRRFDFGTDTVVEAVKDLLKVDRETAEGIISDGAFDISQAVRKAVSQLVKQLIVSRDFVERRENCSVTHIYATGLLDMAEAILRDLESTLGMHVEAWDPFEGLHVAADALASDTLSTRAQYASAVGACLSVLGEDEE